jgi:tRNA threonylcarbamoyladenosine biosynthesis protein TsaB
MLTGRRKAALTVREAVTTICAMLILAIEQSSSRGSAAILRDETVLAEEQWDYRETRGERLFSVLPAMLRSADVQLGGIDVFAPGLGPGSFTGVRIALSAANAFALPETRLVFGVSSIEALALETCADGIVSTVGDARRGHTWSASFKVCGGAVEAVDPLALHPLDGLADVLPGGSVIVSPDWDRLAERLRLACPDDSELVTESRSPGARGVGLLAARRIADDRPSVPLAPLYLHSPVPA